MALVTINWKPGRRELKAFGWAMILGFGLIGLAFAFWPWARPIRPNLSIAIGCWAFGVFAGVLGWSGSRAALLVYWPWMGVAFVFGNILSRILIAVFFYGMITPMGLCMRLLGRDRLHLRRRGDETTYWRDVPQAEDKARYERQF
ncbi:MAG: hypothetical protein V1918_06305 [Planctomycetota bacterium]